MRIIEGNLLAGDDRFAIVVSRFNESITTRLLAGALDALRRHGTLDEHITVVHVPGSFEIPIVAGRLANSRKYEAVICLGAVIEGETTHHEYINQQVAAGIKHVAHFREPGGHHATTHRVVLIAETRQTNFHTHHPAPGGVSKIVSER